MRVALVYEINTTAHAVRVVKSSENRTFTWCKLSFLIGQFEFEVYIFIYKPETKRCISHKI